MDVKAESLIPIIITGPSGVGKGTLIDRLRKEFDGSFGHIVSHTTRKPRDGEAHGVHYYFTDIPTMTKEIENGDFIEHANVHGNFYGTSKRALQEVAEKGKICILDIDVQGCESVKKAAIPCKYIFISPPTFETLEKRLIGRGTETEQSLKKRLETAKKEMEYRDMPGFFDHVIVNNVLDVAYDELKQIILPYINYQKSISK
ncbi:guanylate kinase [Dictyostelium purpureum]|uniref:guanylate kinase n=1 Tax=Dictyostelium purpureum TaxID=5786 RepID=F1A0P3_DICPU|nr:guanylate kinase [Dictyostelium purpureum]EGC30245.1 guanylate kinase [Dictyostelium purpureum]|eukprot:XP_003293237.1 guanylate kinase [Dictyostelium purpureum]